MKDKSIINDELSMVNEKENSQFTTHNSPLPKGYKNTEIGVIPEDWEIDLLENITNVIDPHPSHRAPQEVAKGIPFLGIGDLNENGIIIKKKYRKVNVSIYDEHNKRYDLSKNLLGLGRVASIGKVIKLKSNIGKYTISPTLGIIDAFDVRTEFLYFILNSNYIKNYFAKIMSGSTRSSVGMIVLRKIPIPLPPLPEQTAIATVLSDTDNLIQALEKKIAKKQLIKKGSMQKLLSPKEGWERVTLNKVIEVSRGGSPRPIQDYITSSPDGINWIKIGDTSPVSKYITESKEKIIQEGVQYSRIVKVGDFLLSNSMSFGRPYILKINGCIHDGWLVLQNYEKSFDREFLYYTLMSQDVFNQYLAKASGSGVLNLNKELVKTVKLNKPKSIQEQTRIAQILSDMDAEIETLEKKLAKYKQIKQGLMQVLLTGKIRLV